MGFIFLVAFTGLRCDDNNPEKEDTPELITKVTLTFTPQGGGDPVIVTATDDDLDGPNDIEVDGTIILSKETTYILTILLTNELAEPSGNDYNISDEIEEEGDEHMFFFAWTEGIFSNPAGNGNIDNRSDAVRYEGGTNALDEDGLPLGLTTTWTTANVTSSGEFQIILKHQPGSKTNTSGVTTGETDLDITFSISLIE
jgi:hypothetical protein